MICKHFHTCGGCEVFDSYENQIANKTQKFKDLFGFFPDFIFKSPQNGFRSRAEFRIIFEPYPYDPLNQIPPKIFLSTSAKSKNFRIPITSCLILLPHLQDQILQLPLLLSSSPLLYHKLYAINLLGNLSKDSIITLIYHKPLDEKWKQSAQELAKKLKCSLIGRSKNQKIVIGSEMITNSITLQYPSPHNQKSISNTLYLSHLSNTFSQPNPFINQKMLQFIIDTITPHERTDLLEMYCGSGNFTLVLSKLFRKIFATEIVKSALNMLKQNQEKNHISNIIPARLSGGETIEALSFKRKFFRLKSIDLSEFNFSHILVDPPRSGIQDKTILSFLSKFETIIYISCNPTTLQQDLIFLLQTHQVEKSAIFDQFPHTHHLESAIILKKNKRC